MRPMRVQFIAAFLLFLFHACIATAAREDTRPASQKVTLMSLRMPFFDNELQTLLPEPEYKSLQASSYNRASIKRGEPGWFADSDGTGFIRVEENNGHKEWVIMEHDGPGCITHMWTPFFYNGNLNDHIGPNIRIYLDGAKEPLIDESFIQLTLCRGSFNAAQQTARAGVCDLPVPFGRSCKITMTGRPFYYIINYRAYRAGTEVTTLLRRDLRSHMLQVVNFDPNWRHTWESTIQPLDQFFRIIPGPTGIVKYVLPEGPACVWDFTIQFNKQIRNYDAALRSLVIRMTFDEEVTVECPVGDFFCCPDSLHPLKMAYRTVDAEGRMTCRWVMPWKSRATVELINRGTDVITGNIHVNYRHSDWSEKTMHFHASWHPDEILPGTPIVDWNLITIQGKGVIVGDALTVLNPTQGWWGEGDEKIYVDGAWDAGFPTQFGTGTEDYYGWAGGVVPTRADEFSTSYVANVRVGGVDGNGTRGYNICTRERVLDAIPFNSSLHFDMEASAGVDQRAPTDMLGYSAVVFWYALPGATCNRTMNMNETAAPIMTLDDLARRANAARAKSR
ncbi:MAG: DUF2961 domain-containing protein [Planctomycetes bacterium]|nr:DUF2961 domain-containing protein [Planctomycetota bacterium]